MLLYPGTYHITPVLGSTAPGRLLCDGLLTSADAPVADFNYVFVLESDCTLNCVEDSIDIEDEGGANDVWPMDGHIDGCYWQDCDPDINHDGNTDQDDVGCMINVVSGNPSCADPNFPPDFNHDGNVDQDVVLALMNTVAGGGCPQ